MRRPETVADMAVLGWWVLVPGELRYGAPDYDPPGGRKLADSYYLNILA